MDPAAALRARVAIGARFAAKAAETGEPRTTAMVALVVPGDVAEAIVLPNGEPIQELHLTLAFLGQLENIPSVRTILKVVEICAEFGRPLTGWVSGIARFSPSEGDGPDAIVALADLPALPAFRERLVNSLLAVDAPVAMNHGYTPHITLAYTTADQPMPLQRLTPVAATFAEIEVAFGDRVRRFPFKLPSFAERWDEAYAGKAAGIGSYYAQDPAPPPAQHSRKAADGDEPETVAQARSRKVDAYAALIAALFGRLQSGSISEAQYLREVGDGFDAAIGDVVDSATETVQRLRDKAIANARALVDHASQRADAEDAPSPEQKRGWGNMVAGALWAAQLAAVAFRKREDATGPLQERLDTAEADAKGAKGDDLDELRDQIANLRAEIEQVASTVMTWRTIANPPDPHTCPDCEDLDGQSWPLDEVPFWPGEGDFGENTECGPNCRCSLDPPDTSDDEEEAA